MIFAIVFAVLFGLWILWSWVSVRNIEKPTYTVIESNDVYEVRAYEPMLIAKATVEGTRDEATNEGFRLIADFIFGNNTVNEGIAMTVPVSSKESEPIAMTAPVTSAETEAGVYTIAFVMPSKYTLETLPKPNNSQVEIEEVSSKNYAVISFSGYAREAQVEEMKTKLFEALEQADLSFDESYTLSQYTPPWSPWFMRHNEIWVELK